MLNLPNITKNLLIINLLCWLTSMVTTRYGFDLNEICGLHFFMASNFHIWQPLTYMFMHANFEHIFFNMFAVWMFGATLEHTWGGKRFLVYYLACGIGAALVQEIVQYIQFAPLLSAPYGNTGTADAYLSMMNTIGASGAVYGILMAFGMLFPNTKLFIIPFPFPIKAKWLIMGYFAIELLLGIFSTSDGVAHFAHLGGMVFGLLLILHWQRVGYTGDLIGQIKKKLRKKAKMKFHYKEPCQPENPTQEIDRILDKLRHTGYDGLTDEEKKKLFDSNK